MIQSGAAPLQTQVGHTYNGYECSIRLARFYFEFGSKDVIEASAPIAAFHAGLESSFVACRSEKPPKRIG